MVRMAKLGTAFLVCLASSTSASAQEEQWTRCVPKVERAPIVKFGAFDFTDHPSGGHHEGRIFFFPQCQYFRDCTTACYVESAPWVDENGVDLTFPHATKTEKEDGSGTGSKGASVSCTGAAVMAVETCPLGLCDIDIQWTKRALGITFESTHLWRWGQIHTHTCAPPTRATEPGPGGGGRPNPNRCHFCGTAPVCGPWYTVCPDWADGRSRGDDDCGDWQRDCIDVERWCCPFGASTEASSTENEPVCGDWMETAVCEPGSTCCLDSQQFPSGPSCASAGLFAESEEAQCAESCGAPCEPASVVEGDCDSEGCNVTRCWQCSSQDTTCAVPVFTASANTARVGEEITFTAEADSIQEPPTPLWDLGNGVSQTGNPVNYAYSDPGTYSVRLVASDATCGSVQVSAPQTVTITASEPSCGALGGDYCSQTGSCPSGYDSLGNSSDCSPCCKPSPQPSCGAMGGDYCSQTGSCPANYTSLGGSSDCSACCKYEPPPSCGAMGGDYCSQTGSCPEGYGSLGGSSDCVQCCRSEMSLLDGEEWQAGGETRLEGLLAYPAEALRPWRAIEA